MLSSRPTTLLGATASLRRLLPVLLLLLASGNATSTHTASTRWICVENCGHSSVSSVSTAHFTTVTTSTPTVMTTSTPKTTVTPSATTTTSTKQTTTTSTTTLSSVSTLTSTSTASTDTTVTAATSTSTSTTTSTTTMTSSSTTVVPTTAGFVPIQDSVPSASYNGDDGSPVADKRAARRTARSEETRRGPLLAACTTESVECTEHITSYAPTQTSTVTATTSTVTASQKTKTAVTTVTTTATATTAETVDTTVMTTVTTTSTTTTTPSTTVVDTATATATYIATVTEYAQCRADNYMNVLLTASGSSSDVQVSIGGGRQNFNTVSGPQSALACCEYCAQTSSCGVAFWYAPYALCASGPESSDYVTTASTGASLVWFDGSSAVHSG